MINYKFEGGDHVAAVHVSNKSMSGNRAKEMDYY